MRRNHWVALLLAAIVAFGVGGSVITGAAGILGLVAWSLLGAVVGGVLGICIARAER